MKYVVTLLTVWMLCLLSATVSAAPRAGGVVDDNQTVRIFIFAGQSNMEGGHSKAADINRFPPFVGLDKPQNASK
jgi:hypothetical protein